jgi:hypothetical protein
MPPGLVRVASNVLCSPGGVGRPSPSGDPRGGHRRIPCRRPAPCVVGRSAGAALGSPRYVAQAGDRPHAAPTASGSREVGCRAPRAGDRPHALAHALEHPCPASRTARSSPLRGGAEAARSAGGREASASAAVPTAGTGRTHRRTRSARVCRATRAGGDSSPRQARRHRVTSLVDQHRPTPRVLPNLAAVHRSGQACAHLLWLGATRPQVEDLPRLSPRSRRSNPPQAFPLVTDRAGQL